MAQQAGTLNFTLNDYREIEYNESTDLSYDIYLEDIEDELLDIERYVEYCMSFARAVGFNEKTVNEAFRIEV